MKSRKAFSIASIALASVGFLSVGGRALADCGPFTDIGLFCAPILELYSMGIAAGTSPTTFDPGSSASRGEIASFLARSINQTVKRASPRAALGQWWTPKSFSSLALTSLSGAPQLVASDGADVWVATDDQTISRVRASDGKPLDQWTGEIVGTSVLVAMGRVFTGGANGKLYGLDPREAGGTLAEYAAADGVEFLGLAFDGSRIWAANGGTSISIITPGASLPWTATTVSIDPHQSTEIVFDGTNIWVTDFQGGALLKLDSNGSVLQSVPVGAGPNRPAFDGANVWVPNEHSDSVTVVRASTGTIVRTLTGNGLSTPAAAAFDGERVLVTSLGGTVSLWRAADLTPLGTLATSTFQPYGVCSDGRNFWIALRGAAGALARF